MKQSKTKQRIAVVLGGGGLKGFAHIGVLQALREYDVEPVLYAGTSIGALVAGAAAGGMPIDEMERRALALRRKDLFRINHMGMLLERMQSPSIYLGAPLRALVDDIVPSVHFDALEMPLLVNTVDVERGAQIIWGLPGFRDVSVADAVYASCALPGFFPPGRVDARVCIDGGVVDNMPAAAASHGMDAIIAVDVGMSDLTHMTDIARQGFAALYMRAATIMMHALQLEPLTRWSGPPMILIRPRVAHVPWLSFTHTEELIAEGYRMAMQSLDQYHLCLSSTGGIFPRREVKLSVDRLKCTGCGLCAALAPDIMALDAEGKAYPRTEILDWSPADGDFVRHCPTLAIEAHRSMPVLDDAAD